MLPNWHGDFKGREIDTGAQSNDLEVLIDKVTSTLPATGTATDIIIAVSGVLQSACFQFA